MVKDAEAHADEDKKRREEVERRNQGETLIHTTEKSLTEHGDKISEEEKKAIEDAIAELKTALEGDDQDAIQAKIEVLAEASMKLGEAMYKASQEAAAAAEGGAEGAASGDGADASGSDDKVVDADFEEVDEDKKNKAD